MPVAETPWHVVAGAKSAELRTRRRQQREQLRGKPARELIPVLVNPPPELASYTLQKIFAAGVDRSRGVIPMFGPHKLNRALQRLQGEGHFWARPEQRLRDLTCEQRRILVRAIFDFAPIAWREAAA